MHVFVGNMAYRTDSDMLRAVFEVYGTVRSVRVITDRDTGCSRGFGFVEMPNEEEASAAIEAVNGSKLDGRVLKVSEAQPRSQCRPRRTFIRY